MLPPFIQRGALCGVSTTQSIIVAFITFLLVFLWILRPKCRREDGRDLPPKWPCGAFTFVSQLHSVSASKNLVPSCSRVTDLLANDPLVDWHLDKEPVFWPNPLPRVHCTSDEAPFKLAASYLDALSARIMERFLPLGDPHLNDAATCILQAGGGGKKIRSLMVFLVSKALSETVQPLEQRPDLAEAQDLLAQIVEVIHAATLLHDDVIDEAETRRGETAAHKVKGAKIAILGGDCLLARANQASARLSNIGVVQTLAVATEHLVTGEVLQLVGANQLEQYLQKTFYKAGSLMAGACMSAAMLGNYPSQTIESCYRYGKHVGVAFQLTDDVLDFQGDFAALGKPVFNDLKAGLVTAPVIFAAEQFSELKLLIERRFSLEGDADRAADLVAQSDGIERAKKLARVHAECAIEAAMEIGDSIYRDGLVQLAQMTVNRDK